MVLNFSLNLMTRVEEVTGLIVDGFRQERTHKPDLHCRNFHLGDVEIVGRLRLDSSLPRGSFFAIPD